MANFETLFSKYDKLVLFDTETTGLQFTRVTVGMPLICSTTTAANSMISSRLN